MLNPEQAERYDRQILLREIGAAGQAKILAAKILVVGAGGLGSPAALYLAAAGVGTLGIADGDAVELSNLHRQILHFTADIGRPKVESAAEKIRALNPGVRVVAHHAHLDGVNARKIIRDYDFVVDGTDNFPAKFLVGDACVAEGKPYAHAGILRFHGQALTWVPGAACYRCVFREPPSPGAVPACCQAGVLGAVAGLLGVIQAAEAIRYVTGCGKLLVNRLLTVDLLDMAFREVPVRPDPACPACGGRR